MRISKKNEVYLVLDDMTDSTRQELTEFFTFEVPGFKFMPMYRNRMWDGKIRLFSPATGEIYVGLLEYIKGFCQKNGIDYILEEGVENERIVVGQVVRDFIRSHLNRNQKVNQSRFVTTKFMRYTMLYPQIVLCLFLLLLLVNHS